MNFLFSVFLFVFLFPFCVFADSPTSLVFITNPQTITAGIQSTSITIQLQNSSGSSISTGETNTLMLKSSSASGQFSSSSTASVLMPTQSTWNSNWKSRTFYYEDSTPGIYTISATVTDNTTHAQFSASQQITITNSTGNNSSSSDNSNASADDSTASSTSDTSSSDSDNDSTYSYSSQATIYGGQEDEPFNVTIGRNRLVTVGEPVAFQAKMIPADASYSGASFHFSFGDGTEWNGMLAKHTYEYPGEYVVILDATRYSDEAVAQVKVKVVSADLSLQNVANDSVTIKNNGSDEINIGGWTLSDNLGGFTLPEDTIVEGNSNVTIPATVMKTKSFSGTVALYNPSNTEIAYADVGAEIASDAISAPSKSVSIALPSGMTADNFAQKFGEAFANAMKTQNSSAPAAATAEAGAESQVSSETALASSTSEVANSATNSPSTNVAAVIYTVPRASNGSIFSGITSWIGNLFGGK